MTAPLSEEHHWISNRGMAKNDDAYDAADADFMEVDNENYDFKEDLYGNNPNDIESDDKYDIEDKQDFSTVLQKVRTISKAATVTQKRILSFDSYCHAAKLKSLYPIQDHAIRWSATFNMLEHVIYLKPAIDMWI